MDKCSFLPKQSPFPEFNKLMNGDKENNSPENYIQKLYLKSISFDFI